MTPRITDVATLGILLVQSECTAPLDAHVLETATNEVMRKLQASLTHTLGFSGVGALAARSLRIAQRAHPRLAAVTMGTEAAVLRGLSDVLLDAPSADAIELSAAIPQAFINLLVNLIGADVALIPISNIWPAVCPRRAPPADTENDV